MFADIVLNFLQHYNDLIMLKVIFVNSNIEIMGINHKWPYFFVLVRIGIGHFYHSISVFGSFY